MGTIENHIKQLIDNYRADAAVDFNDFKKSLLSFARDLDTAKLNTNVQDTKKALRYAADAGYLLGVFNVVGVDGLHRELVRLDKLKVKPADLIMENLKL